MDRLNHLRETLPDNISGNEDYTQLEFVVLNYNSNDEMDKWMRPNQRVNIESGKIVYIKTTEPKYFKVAHAKNMAVRFATGDIVCNIDADNFTGKGFARYINEEFNNNPNIFLTANQKGYSDLCGKVCVWKSDFSNVRGYDEKILDYGYEDVDFYSRLKRIGRSEMKIKNSAYLQSIKHGVLDRIKNGQYMQEIEFVLMQEIEHIIKAWVFKANKQFEHLIIHQQNTTHPGHDKGGIIVNHGVWMAKENELECQYINIEKTVTLKSDNGGNSYNTTDGEYTRMPKIEACYQYSMIKGLMILNLNDFHKGGINPDGFGQGQASVVRSF